MQKVLRPSKFGGVSMCGAPDDKVGKGRCHHILTENDTVTLNYNKNENCYYVDLKNQNSSLSVKAKEETISKFFNELKDNVDEETKNKIVKFLENKAV